jgi:hypothetical protein
MKFETILERIDILFTQLIQRNDMQCSLMKTCQLNDHLYSIISRPEDMIVSDFSVKTAPDSDMSF